MKRPYQHEIETDALRIFQSTIPRTWVFREQNKDDYGIDGELEIFYNQKTTGMIIKVQLKGTESIEINKAGDTISYQFAVDKAEYLCDEIHIPAVFIVCDVLSGNTYWSALQIDRDFRRRLVDARSRKHATVVIHLPITNMLRTTLLDLVDAADISRKNIALQSMIKDDMSSLIFSTVSGESSSDAINKLTGHANIARLTNLENRFQSGEIDGVLKEIALILDSPGIDARMRFSVCELLERVKLNGVVNSSRVAEVELDISERLRLISINGPLELKAYALFRIHAARLHNFSIEEFGLFMNSGIQGDIENDFWKLILNQRRLSLSVRIHREYTRCVKYMELMIDKGGEYLLSQAVIRLIYAMMLFTQRLLMDGLLETANQYITFLRGAIDLGVEVSCKRNQWNDVMQLAIATLGLILPEGDDKASEAIEYANTMLEKIDDKAVAKRAKKLVNRQIEIVEESRKQQFDEDDEEVEKAIYIEMASVMGIDLSDPDDLIAKVIRIGIKDLNPGRVLKNCKNLFIAVGAMGEPARRLRMPSAGFKLLWCTKKGNCNQGLDLDRTYEAFENGVCKNCSEREPHPENWKYTKKWQREQNVIHEDLLKNNPFT